MLAEYNDDPELFTRKLILREMFDKVFEDVDKENITPETLAVFINGINEEGLLGDGYQGKIIMNIDFGVERVDNES